MIVPPAPLRLLARRKFQGWWRKQLRRARTPGGAILALIGLTVIGGWFAWMIFSVVLARGIGAGSADVANAARGVGLFAALFTTLNALSMRGLYIPREEIELLFAAPLARADLVRHRLWVAGLRSMFGGLFMGLFIALEAPVRAYGVIAAVLGLWTLAAWSQAVAIVAGALERRVLDRLTKATRWLAIGLFALLVLGFLAWSTSGEHAWVSGLRERMLQGLPGGRLSGLLSVEPLRTLALPIEPWARLAAAPSALAGLPWLALCVLLWACGIELAARLPIDFRELSLETSSNIAERIRRVRRSGGAVSSSKVRALNSLRRVPWCFGRSPLGAIAWRKTAGVVRRARGTLFMSLLVIALLSLLVRSFGGEGASAALLRSGMFALFGTFYLCNGLRFDFREDLGRLAVMKTWPVGAWTLFCATLLPQWSLVTLLLCGALCVLNLVDGGLSLELAPVLFAVPLLVAYWIAIDNIVFLLAPFRTTPGQDGMLQNAGRAMLMGLVRMVVYGLFAGTIGLAFAGTWRLLPLAGVSERSALALGTLAGLGVGCVGAAALTWVGGRALARFDVAREGA
ncbi:MAG: hypothetical protein EPO68_16800 [Planctomycetota bacterium]|nr:MAG: hypothetical protein EPO68_16800 [Planctomycetota bacterium]